MVTARTRATLNTAAAAARDAVGGVADLDAGGRADRAAGEALSSALAWSVLRTVADPEIPVLSVVELGIVRAIEIAYDRKTVTVTVTPTYIGCPATEMIAQDIVRALTDAGAVQVVVRQQLAPAWSTDWIEPAARERMRAYGIVPPAVQSPHARLEQPLRFVVRESVRESVHESVHESAHESVRVSAHESTSESAHESARALPAPSDVLHCPRCASADTERLSYFGSTACKALYRCRACREPFEYFKPL